MQQAFSSISVTDQNLYTTVRIREKHIVQLSYYTCFDHFNTRCHVIASSIQNFDDFGNVRESRLSVLGYNFVFILPSVNDLNRKHGK